MFKCLHYKMVAAIAVTVAVLLIMLFCYVPSLQYPRIIFTTVFCYFTSLLILSCCLDSGRPPLEDRFCTSSEKEEETTSDPPKYEDVVAQETSRTILLEGEQNYVLDSNVNSTYQEPPPPYHEAVIGPIVDNEEVSSSTM